MNKIIEKLEEVKRLLIKRLAEQEQSGVIFDEDIELLHVVNNEIRREIKKWE